MFSANDIRGMEFETERKGYNTADVRAFLATIAAQFDELTKAKEECEKNMLILADKIEEYREKDDRISAALISTQKVCDSLILDAKNEADQILANANAEAEEIISNANAHAAGITEEIAAEEEQFKLLKERTQQFKLDVLEIYKTHLELLSLFDDIGEEPVVEENVEDVVTEEPAAEEITEEPEIQGTVDFIAPGYTMEVDVPVNGFSNTMEVPIGDMIGDIDSVLAEEPPVTGDTFKTIEVAPRPSQDTFDFSDSFTIPEAEEPTTEPAPMEDIFATLDSGVAEETVAETAPAEEVAVEETAVVEEPAVEEPAIEEDAKPELSPIDQLQLELGVSLPTEEEIDYDNFDRLDTLLPEGELDEFNLENVETAEGEKLSDIESELPEIAEPADEKAAPKKSRRHRFPSVNKNANGDGTSRFGKLDFGSDFSFDI